MLIETTTGRGGRRAGLIISLVAVIGLAGMAYGAGAQVVPGGKKAANPKEACRNMARAMEKENKALFLDNAWAGDDAASKQRLNTLIDAFLTMNSFVVAYEKAYGKDEALKTEGVSEADVEGFVFQEEGDKATAKDKEGKLVQCIRKDGGWVVDLSEELKDPASIQMLESVAKIFAEMRPQIGKLSKDEFQRKMGEKMMGGAPPPAPEK